MDDKVRTNRVDWDFWLDMQIVKIWQAVALSMNIDPDKFYEERTAEGYDGYRTKEEKDKFNKRCEILTNKVFTNENLRSTKGVRPKGINQRKNANSEIYLKSFPEWALRKNWDIPEELKSLVDPEDLPEETKQEETKQEETKQEELCALFDPKKRKGITKLFPLSGFNGEGNKEKWNEEEWRKLFDKAARNGLIKARAGAKGIYNPFKVGEWLVENDYYTQQHINGKLANNLPTRSQHKKGLITNFRATELD